MKQKIFLLAVITLVMMAGCKKKEDDTFQQRINYIAPTTAFPGTILTISINDLPEDINAITVKIGASASVKPLSVTNAQLTVKIPDDATAGKVQIFVNGKTFISTEDFTPAVQTTVAITDFTPKQARPGSNITITGSGFGNDPALLQVSIGNTLYAPVSVSPTSLVVQTHAYSTSGKVKVVRGASTTYSAEDFKALPEPNGLGYSLVGYDSRIQLGSIVSIKGSFGNVLDYITVTFEGAAPVKPTYLSSSGLTIQAIAPRNAKEGKITVVVEGNTLVGKDNYTLTMSARDFTPKTAGAGDTVKFTGVGFTSVSDMTVHFNETGFVRPIKVTPTEMLAIVPSNAVTGHLRIKAEFGTVEDFIYSDDNSLKFIFIPTVSFNNVNTPSSAKIGDVIRINGNFAGADISKIGVSFGGSKSVQPSSLSGSDISVKIPSDAKTGKITISREGYKAFTGSFTLTVMP